MNCSNNQIGDDLVGKKDGYDETDEDTKEEKEEELIEIHDKDRLDIESFVYDDSDIDFISLDNDLDMEFFVC